VGFQLYIFAAWLSKWVGGSCSFKCASVICTLCDEWSPVTKLIAFAFPRCHLRPFSKVREQLSIAEPHLGFPDCRGYYDRHRRSHYKSSNGHHHHQNSGGY